MLNSHKFSEKNCKILKTKLVRSIFIYLEFQKKKKSSVTALRKVFFFSFQKKKTTAMRKVFFFSFQKKKKKTVTQHRKKKFLFFF